MAYSMKKGGKEVGPASVYAKPHTMSGKKVTVEQNPGKGPNHSRLDTVDRLLETFPRPMAQASRPVVSRSVVPARLLRASWPVARWREV